MARPKIRSFAPVSLVLGFVLVAIGALRLGAHVSSVPTVLLLGVGVALVFTAIALSAPRKDV